MRLKFIHFFIFLLFFLVIKELIYLFNDHSSLSIGKISDFSIIEYPADYNYRQTVNDCGPYNVAAVVRALTKKEVDSKEFAKNIKWRLPNKYTLPWGMEKQLKENGINIETPKLDNISDRMRIDFLQSQLSLGRPVIVLGQKNNYQHYLTILGFDKDKDEFYIYDSLFDKGTNGLTIDGNNDLPGNIKLTSQELLDFWRGGGVFMLYNWYILVASTDIKK